MARRPGRKKGYTKAQRMAKSRIAAKKTATSTSGGSNNTTKLSGISKLQSLGRAPTKPGDSVAARRFREREAQGLSGLTGRPKPGSTDAQVARDNAMYGNTFPSGAFNITATPEEKSIKSAITSSPSNTSLFGLDYSPFSTSSLNSSFTGLKGLESFQNTGYRAPVTKSAKQMRFGIPYNDPGRTGTLGGWGNWFDKGVNKRLGDESRIGFGAAWADDKAQIGKFKNLKTGKLETGLFGTGIPKNWKQVKQTFQGEGGLGFSFGKGADTGPTGIQRMLVRRFLPVASNIGIMRDIFNAGSDTGIRKGVETIGTWNDKVSFLPTAHVKDPKADIGHNLGKKIFGIEENKNRLSRVLDGTERAARGTADLFTGNFFDFDNLGGQTEAGIRAGENREHLKNIRDDSLDIAKSLGYTFKPSDIINNLPWNKEQPKFATFREDAEQNRLIQPKNFFGKDGWMSDIKSDVSKAFGVDNTYLGMGAAALGTGKGDYKAISDLVGDTKSIVDAKGAVNKAKAWQNLSIADQQNLINAAGSIVDNSKTFESLGQRYTEAPDFKTQTQDSLAAINKSLKEASKDTKGRVDPINKLLQNMNSIDGYKTVSRFLNQQEKNPDASLKTKISNAYNPNSGLARALSYDDRGIVGSGGNLLIGGKLSDIFRANNPYGEAGRGTEFTPVDSANLIANATIAANTPGSLTQQRFNEIGRLIDPDKGITPGSLIRGTLPRLPRLGGGGTNTSNNNRLSGTARTLGDVATEGQPLEELLPLDQLPQTQLPSLQDAQNQAYIDQMNVYGLNPNYLANIMQPTMNTRPTRFRNIFNRNYFA